MLLLLLFITPIIAILLSLMVKKQRYLLETIAIISASIELLAIMLLVSVIIAENTYTVPYFSINALGGLILGITGIVGFIATLHSVGYLRAEQAKEMIGFKRVKECFILMRVFLLCMFIAITTANPIIMWIAIEATTLSTVFLISFFNRNADIEAAWKYLIINSIGLLLGLLGTVLFLAQERFSGGVITWDNLLQATPHMNILMSKFAFVFILIGYGTKMGLVPMHTWKPDTYNKAPLPIVALLSGALLNVAFFAILHFKLIIDHVAGSAFSQTLFIFFGILSVCIPALIIYTQVNYKRMLAYSSIEHAGIMLLGFGFGGIGIFGALLHMMYHAFAKSLLFFLSSNIALKYSSSKIATVTGMIRTLPRTSILYLLGFFAIVGIPPSGIFFSEFYILLAGFHQHLWISLAMILGLLLVFVGLFRQVTAMVFGKPPTDIPTGEINTWTIVPITALAVLLIIAGIYLPDQVMTLLKASSALFIYTK